MKEAALKIFSSHDVIIWSVGKICVWFCRDADGFYCNYNGVNMHVLVEWKELYAFSD